MEDSISGTQEGLAQDDAWAGFAHYVSRCVAFRSGAFAPLAGTIETTPAMWRLAKRGRGLVEQLATRAHRSGALRPDAAALDIAYLIEQFARRTSTESTDEEDNVRRRLLAIALDGLRAPGTEPLPGTTPSAVKYEKRWRTAR